MTGFDRRLHSRVSVPDLWARLTRLEGARKLTSRVRIVDLSLDGVRWLDEETTITSAGTSVSLLVRPHRLFGRAFELGATVVRRHQDEERSTAAQLAPAVDRVRLKEYLRGVDPTLNGAADSAPSPIDPAAAFGVLAATLDPGAVGSPRIILVSSALPAEGKSFVATGIALALARMGRRVLMVDADLCAPTQHLAFQVKGAPGLAQLCGGLPRTGVEDLVQMSDAGVAVLAAGWAGGLPAMSPAAEELLTAKLRGVGYSVVVIDAPPVLAGSDALRLSRIANDTLVTVRSGVTRERDLQEALDLLRRQGTPATGIILNDHTDPRYPVGAYGRAAYAPLGEPWSARAQSSGGETRASAMSAEGSTV